MVILQHQGCKTELSLSPFYAINKQLYMEELSAYCCGNTLKFTPKHKQTKINNLEESD